MSNLSYCWTETKSKINAILNSPATHNMTKDIIRAGLEKDCVDAVRDVQQALNALKLVMDDCTN